MAALCRVCRHGTATRISRIRGVRRHGGSVPDVLVPVGKYLTFQDF